MRLFGGGKPRVPADGPTISTAVALFDAELREQKILGATFREIEDETAQRITCGYPAGRIVDDGGGSLRRQNYATTVEAGVDYRVGALEDRDDERAPEARRLAPLAKRWALLRDLHGLSDLGPPKNAVQAHYSAPPDPGAALDPWPAVDDAVDPFVANLVSMRRARADVERERRDGAIRAFEDRQAEAQRYLMRDPFSDASERVRIEAKLAEWNREHAELVDELVREAARGR